MRRGILLLSIFFAISTVVGCTVTETEEGGPAPIVEKVPTPPTPVKAPEWEWQVTEEKRVKEEMPPPSAITIQRELKAPEVTLPPRVGEKQSISITFQAADIKEVLRVLLGELLNTNYVIDQRVRGEFTFRMVGQFYKEELFNIIQTVLSVHDIVLIRRDDMVEVTLLESAKMEAGPLGLGKKTERKGAEIITQVIPLNYVAPQALIPSLRAFMTRAGIVMAPNDAHAIVVVDKASNVERLVAMIDAFDIPFFAGKAVKFYEIKNVNVANLAKDLNLLAESLGAPPKGPNVQIGFVPLADTNRLVVATANPGMLSTIDFWVKQMDVKSPAESRLYIYKLQHKKAEAMASILNDLFVKEGAPKAAVPAPSPEGEPSAPATTGVTPAGPVKVISDTESNALVIRALPQDYQNIRRIIEIMDATPRQVLIEVLIAEVTLTDDLSYGVEYFFRNRGQLDEGFAISLDRSGIGRGTFPPGTQPSTENPLSVTVPEGSRFFFLHKDLDVVLSLLAKTTHIEVLAAPRVLVRHEQKATIQVGSEEPVLIQQQQQTISPGAPVVNTIQYKDVGVILTVTPRIGENNMVTLDVNQEVTSLERETGVAGSPRFTARKAVTSLVVENGRTIVLGGIIEMRNDKAIRRVPVFSRVPLLGELFKSQVSAKRKTELLLILTPYIVSNPEEADKVTKEFERKLEAIGKLRTKKPTKENVAVQ